MARDEQVDAYLHWLKERGLRFPVRRGSPTPEASPQPAAAPAEDAVAAQQSAKPAARHAEPAARHAAAARPARVLFVGDVPSEGGPFAADERELLDKMIAAMRLGARDAAVASALPSRPESVGRMPSVEQCETARQHLAGLIAAARPEAVVLLGGWTARLVLGPRTHFPDARGHLAPSPALGVPVLATYHPRDLLRHPANKRLAWADLQVVMGALGLSAAAERSH